MFDLALKGAGMIADRLFGVQDARQSNHQASQRIAAEQALQREFAQNGIRWKVEDAKAAGIHPLYALGANTVSYSPVSVGESSNPATNFASLGQDLGRAINAGRTGEEKAAAYNETIQKLSVERASLENDVLRQKLRTMIGTASPGLPGGSVPEADKFEDRPKLKAGKDWPTHEDWVNAEDVEKRYGDLVQELYGMGVLAADSWKNWNTWASAQTEKYGRSNRSKLDRYYNYMRGRDSFNSRFGGR